MNDTVDLLIKNGTIVTSTDTYPADVAVRDGKIAAIGIDLPFNAKQTVDATGKYVLPGAIDVHTHLAMPFGGTTSADDYFTGTRAAACGGVTTVFDYAIQRKGMGIIETVKSRDALASVDACVDYAFHCAITDLDGGKLLDEFKKSAEFGVTSFKCFMVYKKEGMMVDDGALYRVLEKARDCGILTNVHAENPDIIDTNIARFLSEGKTSPLYHYLSRPEYAESEADVRAIHWAKELNAPLYIVHLACKDGVDAVKQARSEGYKIFAETCPQYLNFTCDVYERPDAINFVCSPPMKGKESQEALWKALKMGDIQTVATDHCPFQSHEKKWGVNDFTKIPNGCAGIENMYPYLLSEANKGRLSINKVVEVCSTNPAKLFGCKGKGGVVVGNDADLVIYDKEKHMTVSVDNMHSNYDHTIWEGAEMVGYPVATFSRGRLVYKDGEFVGERGWGKLLKRGPSGSL